MIKLLVLIYILVSHAAIAVTEIRMHSMPAQIKQGSLFQAKLQLDSESAQKVELQKLKGINLGNTLYLYSVTPLMKKNEDSNFEAEASLVFTKAPEGQRIIHKLGSEEIAISWTNFEFVPTEESREFIYGKFSIPKRFKALFWLTISVVGIILALLVRKFRNGWIKKIALKKKRSELKSKLFSATQYNDVVDIWRSKNTYLNYFPEIGDHFKRLEAVLYKYQFKQTQNEFEQSEVMTAYQDFIQNIKGGKNGI